MQFLVWLAAAVASGAGGDEAYLACYREVLAGPDYAAASVEELDALRTPIALAVIAHCDALLDDRRREAEAQVRDSEEALARLGGRVRSAGLQAGLVDMRLTANVARDLDRIDPRMQRRRLQYRAAMMLEIEADAALAQREQDVAEHPWRGMEGMLAYGHCLDRAVVRRARDDTAEGAVYAAALTDCAATRALVAPRRGDPMMLALADQNERLLQGDMPALVRELRATMAAAAPPDD